MAYPDLLPSATFWRCPNCGNETAYRANGLAHIECSRCRKVWTEQQLVKAHAGTHLVQTAQT